MSSAASVTTDAPAAVVAELAAAAAAGARVVVAGHLGPDADAIGSVLALHAGLTMLGARARAVIGQPAPVLPRQLAWLPGAEVLGDAGDVPPPHEVDLVVALDTGSVARLGTVAELVAAGTPTVVLDHHASGEAFGAPRWVVPTAPATAVLVAEVLARLGVDLTPALATCLYAGIVADTGRFGFASTDGATLRLAAELMDAGADHVTTHRELFATHTRAELALLGLALSRLDHDPHLRLVSTHVTRAELAAHPAPTDHLVDVLRTAEDADVALVAVPGEPGTWRLSLRSQGPDVGAIARTLGGGGHRLAAGATCPGELPAILARVRTLLAEPDRER